MASYDGFDTLPAGSSGSIQPFQLHVSDSEIADFQTLLKLSKIGPETWENSKASRDQGKYYGITRDWLVDAKDTWLNRFDWRAHEAHINSFPNFKVPVQDKDDTSLTLHFAALFSRNKDAVPVIFMHGWPGSFCEFVPMLDLLRSKYTADTLPFHAIVPSLPGYGLSSGPPLDRDFALGDAARLLHRLMVDGLGFGNGYVAQGGDVGYFLARRLSAEYDACKAVHGASYPSLPAYLFFFFWSSFGGYDTDTSHLAVPVNMLAPPSNADLTDQEGVEPKELESLQAYKHWQQTGAAYAAEHATRPATIGLVLSSSPLALLAWIGEKYIEWADKNPAIPLETILRLTSLYWFTGSFPRNIYPYRDIFKPGGEGPITTTKPLGYSAFKDLLILPKAWNKYYPNMKFRKDQDAGGHFAALEQPQAFLDDVEAFLKIVGPL